MLVVWKALDKVKKVNNEEYNKSHPIVFKPEKKWSPNSRNSQISEKRIHNANTE